MGFYGKQRGHKEAPRTPAGESRKASPIPAPAELEILQSFLNTVARKKRSDELRTAQDLSIWLARHGLLPSGTRLEPADVERAHQVRAGLRALLIVNTGGDLNEPAVAGLDRAAAGARAQVRFDPNGGSRLELVSRDFEGALGTLLGFTHVARREGTWPALKLCAHPDCRRAFFDFTKSNNGKWCTQRCGAKIRAKAWRSRHPGRRY